MPTSGSISNTEFQHIEDTAAASGAVGGFVLGVRNDTAAVVTTTDGDYSQVSVDSAGRIGISDLGGSITIDGTVTADITFDYAEDSPAVSGDMGAFVLAVRNDANAVLTTTNGDYSPFSVTSTGALNIADAGGSITVDGTVAISGTVAVTQSTSPWVVSGTVAATQSGAWSVTVLNGAGAAAVNIQDGGNSITVDGTVAISGTVTTGDNKVEDTGHTTGDTGSFVLAVRNDANAVLTTTNLDYSPIAVNSAGAVSINDGGTSITVDGTVAISGTVAVTQSTSPWVVSGTITTAYQYAEDSPHVSTNVGAFVLAVRNDAGTPLAADQDYIPFTTDATGALRVNAGATVTQTGRDDTDNQAAVATGLLTSVDRNYIWDSGGGNWDRWTGAVTVSGTVAVTQSTSPWVVSGTVASTQSGAWSVAVNNAAGAAAVNIQDGGNSITVDGAVTVSGTITTAYQYAEDSGHVTTNVGAFTLGVRNDTAAVLTSTDLDYSPFATDSAGRIGISDLGGSISIDDNGGSITVDGTVAATQSGAWSVAVNNASGAAAVNIQDGGNSITVDGTVAVSGTVAVTQSTSPWVVSGTITTAYQYAEDSPHVSTNVGAFVLAVRNDAGTPLAADQDYIPFTTDATGALRVTGGGSSVTQTGRDDTDNQAAVTTGLLTSVDRNYIWDSVGGNWDRWTGAVTFAGTVTTGDNKAEDSVHTTGDTGSFALAVRNDAGTPLAASGDYIPFTVDANGDLYVTTGRNGSIANGAETAITGTAAQILAANTARKKYIVQNTGTANIRVGITGVTATTGFRLVPSGSMIVEMPNCPTNAIFAIREGATSSTAFAQEIT